MSIPYNIIELFTKYFIDKNKGQFELNEILQNLKRGNSFRIMWELFQKLKDNQSMFKFIVLFLHSGKKS